MNAILIGIIFFILVLQLLNALLNVLFSQRLPQDKIEGNDLVSVLIPARNEALNIGHLLEDLSKEKDINVEIIICDDASTDNTAEIVQDFRSKDSRISLITSAKLPDNWLGKNHACHQLAKVAKGNYFLFIDADVRIDSTVISAAELQMKKWQLSLLSVFPKQVMVTLGEKASVPLMNYILLTLLPLFLVRCSPFAAHAAANGQFMMFKAEDYKRNKPHEKWKMACVEDIEIARDYKKNGLKVATITGEKRVRCRMYTSYREALQGFSKNLFMFFGDVKIAAFFFWIISAFGGIIIALLSVQWLPLYLLLLVATQLLYAMASKQNIINTLLLFPVHLFFMAHVMIVSMVNAKRRSLTWKGRLINKNNKL